MLNIKEIEELIIDSLFINEKRLNNTLLNISGVRGWVSPIRDGWANRICYKGAECLDETIQAVVDFYAKRKCGFVWFLRPQDISSGLSARLINHGLKPSHFHNVAGVYLAANSISKSTNSKVTIRDVTNEDMEPYLDMINRAYGHNSVEYVRYMNIIPEAERAIKMRYYIAFSENYKKPIGYAKTGYLKNGEVLLLLGAAVLEEHRGQGVYAELLRYRIEQGIQDGIHHFISQASKTSSYNSFRRFGFDDICDIQIFEWSPD